MLVLYQAFISDSYYRSSHRRYLGRSFLPTDGVFISSIACLHKHTCMQCPQRRTGGFRFIFVRSCTSPSISGAACGACIHVRASAERLPGLRMAPPSQLFLEGCLRGSERFLGRSQCTRIPKSQKQRDWCQWYCNCQSPHPPLTGPTSDVVVNLLTWPLWMFLTDHAA